MKLLETILVATVFGPTSDAAVRTAVALAKKFQSKILLLHVIHERVHSLIAQNPGIPELERRLHERHLQSVGDATHDVEVVVERGSAAAVICETAVRRNADLIVLGAGMPTGDPAMRLGTTAERVLRAASTPVWVAEQGSTGEPRHILCPVDVSAASTRALKNAHHLSRKLDAKLTVLHVLEPASSFYRGVAVAGDSVDAGFFAPQKLQLDEFLAGLDFHDTNWSKKTRMGRPHEQILAEAKESGADLIVMGTVGKSGFARFVVGSVTDKVSRRLPCSVLTMKAQDMIKLRLEADLKSLEDCLGRGRELLEVGSATDAIREFDRCLVLSPILATAWDGKALAYEQLGDKVAAEQSRENARRIRERLLGGLDGIESTSRSGQE